MILPRRLAPLLASAASSSCCSPGSAERRTTGQAIGTSPLVWGRAGAPCARARILKVAKKPGAGQSENKKIWERTTRAPEEIVRGLDRRSWLHSGAWHIWGLLRKPEWESRDADEHVGLANGVLAPLEATS